jgi:hypothetical protein
VQNKDGGLSRITAQQLSGFGQTGSKRRLYIIENQQSTRMACSWDLIGK